MKSFLEWYLGIPPAQPGQGTQWTWLRQTPWPANMPPWLVVLLLVAVAASVIWVYRRDARNVSLPWRVVLVGLRLASIAFVLLILTELTLVVDRTGLPFIAVLVDDSASMSLDDQYSDPAERSAVRTLLKDQPDDRTTRLNIAQHLLTGSDGAFLKQLQKRHQLRVYRFAETASVLGGTDVEQGGDLASVLDSIRQLEPTGSDTSPAQAVRKVLNDFRGSLPSAIVVFSDGISSTGDADRLTVGADLAARRLVPLYTVGVGSEEAMHDLNLYDTLTDEVAFVNDPVTLTAKLKSFGFSGRNVSVVLKEKESGAVLGSTKVKAGKDGQTVPVELTWAPDAAGDYEVVLEASPQQTEIDRSNNAETRQISVREERLRVLLIDSLPRWEFRELKTLLERETTIELHTILQDADLEYVDQDTTAQPLRGRFPVSREQLFAYD
ncbi:MAG: vWA domain-containing protein, partial [Planctomycetota bacterium]